MSTQTTEKTSVGPTRTVAGVFQAERLKLRKRPALWILAGVLLVVVALFGYLTTYTIVAGGQDLPGLDHEAVLASLLPAQLVLTVLGQLAAFGAPIALILAALAVGSEYGWGTVKTIAVQGPGRGSLLAGKFLAIAVVLLLLVAATLVVGWMSSVAIASIEGGTMALPPLGELIGGLGAGWLILVPYALLGAVLALAFRSSGLALGLGLVYVIIVENVILTLPLGERFGEVMAQVGLGPNVLELSRAFGDPPVGAQMIAVGAGDVGQAVAVLAAYSVAFAAIGLIIFRRRPIA